MVAGGIDTVADDDHGAAKLVARLVHHQLLAGGVVDGVVHGGATAGTHAADAGFERLHIVREIGDHLHVAVEGGQHHQILARPHYRVHETNRRLLFETEAVCDAVGGVDQNGDAERQVRFGRELENALLLFVFGNVEIFLAQISYETSLFVGDGEQDVDARDVDGDGGFGRI